MIVMTENAHKAVIRFIHGLDKPMAGLRIRVAGGGCSGYRYSLKLEECIQEDDELVDLDGVRLLVDAQSAPLLQGVMMDFIESMESSGFTFDNPNATHTCSCGKSFAC